MPVVLKKVYSINGNYSPEERALLQEMIEQFRLRVSDDDPEKNILNKKTQVYTDNTIVGLFNAAKNDLNGGAPRTRYTIKNIADMYGYEIILKGAMIFAMTKEGILQLRNQIDYSDSGISIAMFNKTGLYQGWAGFLLNEYFTEKRLFKASVLPSSTNAGFVSISSEFSYRMW